MAADLFLTALIRVIPLEVCGFCQRQNHLRALTATNFTKDRKTKDLRKSALATGAAAKRPPDPRLRLIILDPERSEDMIQWRPLGRMLVAPLGDRRGTAMTLTGDIVVRRRSPSGVRDAYPRFARDLFKIYRRRGSRRPSASPGACADGRGFFPCRCS